MEELFPSQTSPPWTSIYVQCYQSSTKSDHFWPELCARMDTKVAFPRHICVFPPDSDYQRHFFSPLHDLWPLTEIPRGLLRHLLSSLKCSTGDEQHIRVKNYFVNPDQKVKFNPHAFKKTCVDIGNVLWECPCFSLPLSSGLFWIQLTPPQPYLFGHIAHSPQDCCWKLCSLIAWLLLTINASANTLQSPLSLNWLNNKLAFTAVMIHL